MRVMVRFPHHPWAITDVGQAIVYEMPDEIVSRTVKRETPVTPRGDQFHPAQQRQLVARGRQRKIERSRQIADAELAVRERVHDADPHRARQNFEHFHGVRDDSLGGQPGSGRRDLLAINDLGECISRVRLHSCIVYQVNILKSISRCGSLDLGSVQLQEQQRQETHDRGCRGHVERDLANTHVAAVTKREWTRP